AGNHLEIVLASTDVSYYNERTPNQITISSSPDAPTIVNLPLRALRATTAAPDIDPAAEPTRLPATGGGMILVGLTALGVSRRLRATA
ncbi:MAG: hypothetical protein ACI867_000662, partial [Glaciecola sp.]